VASIFTDRQLTDELEARIEQAWADGADAVELRIDRYDGDPAVLAGYLSSHRARTWIITCRSHKEGGYCDADPVQRASLSAAASRGTGAYIDFEWADYRQDARAREQLHAACADPPAQPRLILSAHAPGGRPEDPGAMLADPTSRARTAVAKVAYVPTDIDETFTALDLMREHGNRTISVAMGEAGLWSRVLSRKLGSFATYASIAPDAVTAPGQLSLGEMFEAYRWREINADTRVFGVLGDPVAHSMSPALFNRWFADAGMNAVYLPLRVPGGGDCLERFLSCCIQRPWLDIGGFSVTLPHKTSALGYLGDGVDQTARSIGAVNTMVFGPAGPTGHNTDCDAAVASMIGALGCSRADLAGLPIDVLGTGGAARAVLAGLRACDCRATVFGRSPKKTQRLARAFNAGAESWDARAKRAGEVLVNCTSVGMWPNLGETPMPAGTLQDCRLVFDLVYNPLQTRLLEQAHAAGARTLNGLDMFIRQAARQFELYTGQTPNTAVARELIIGKIQRRTDTGP
jgi:3-dehydroquinate dehydratase/shikimate dehydrogenase